MTMNSGARGAPRVPTLPTGEQVATYGTYLEAQRAVDHLSVEAQIIKVTDYPEIMQYRALSTPGLVINEKVVSAGRHASHDPPRPRTSKCPKLPGPSWSAHGSRLANSSAHCKWD